MKMIFEAPATVWQEAFPLGNGRIGVLMFGDGEAETLCLNEDTLWSGYPGDPRTGMGYEDIKKAEVYAKEGSYLQATQVLNQAQETAQKYFHCEGAACFHNVDLWRKTSPAAGLANWAFWPFGGAWMCRNLYEEYLFTLDREYLQEIFPVLEEHARFCSNMLQKTDKGLAVVPATSPENCFLNQGEAVPVALYTENTPAIIRNLFWDYLEACEVLKKEGALSGTIREQLPAIVLTQLGSDGRIQEWNEEFTEVEVERRHLSHLYEFHPGRGITKETPELLEGMCEVPCTVWKIDSAN